MTFPSDLFTLLLNKQVLKVTSKGYLFKLIKLPFKVTFLNLPLKLPCYESSFKTSPSKLPLQVTFVNGFSKLPSNSHLSKYLLKWPSKVTFQSYICMLPFPHCLLKYSYLFVRHLSLRYFFSNFFFLMAFKDSFPKKHFKVNLQSYISESKC